MSCLWDLKNLIQGSKQDLEVFITIYWELSRMARILTYTQCYVSY